MGMSRCICRIVSSVSLVLVMLDLNGVLILFSPLNDLSAEQEVTGRVQSILIRAVILGYMELVCCKVSVRVVGKLLPPCSFSCFCHFSCQVFSSLSKHSGDGKSFWYSSQTSLNLDMNSGELRSRETSTDSIIDRPNNAVFYGCRTENSTQTGDGQALG